MKNYNRYLELDALRGIAALAVVMFHYTRYYSNMGAYGHYSFLTWFEHGNLGVHLFFIISGFVIYMSLEKYSKPKDFIISRFSRLYPAYWTCVILTYTIVTAAPFWRENISFTDMLINLTMFQHWFKVKDVDGVYWTLAIELCFYVFMLLLFSFKKLREIKSFGIIWLSVMIIIYYLMINNLVPGINFYYWIPLLKNGTLFFAGIIFYKMKVDKKSLEHFSLLMLCMTIHFLMNPFYESIYIAAFFVVFYLFITNKLKFLINKPLVFLGSISYALYLINQNVGYVILNYLEVSGLKSIYLKLSIALVLIMSLSTAITYLVERPAMKYIRRKY